MQVRTDAADHYSEISNEADTDYAWHILTFFLNCNFANFKVVAMFPFSVNEVSKQNMSHSALQKNIIYCQKHLHHTVTYYNDKTLQQEMYNYVLGTITILSFDIH